MQNRISRKYLIVYKTMNCIALSIHEYRKHEVFKLTHSNTKQHHKHIAL